VVVGVIAFGLLNPDPAYAPTFQTAPEDRPSVLERAGEIGLSVAVGAIWIKIGQAESGPKIRNGHLAGKVHPVTGVPFDEQGFPDFRAAGVVEREVQIEYTGTRGGDFKAANEVAGLEATPDGMTWHHHQDRTTMQLVPEGIHKATGHTGGYGLSDK
jgi:A nuclease of the HNH/ENDO VII superfamily with conserved WHH